MRLIRPETAIQLRWDDSRLIIKLAPFALLGRSIEEGGTQTVGPCCAANLSGPAPPGALPGSKRSGHRGRTRVFRRSLGFMSCALIKTKGRWHAHGSATTQSMIGEVLARLVYCYALLPGHGRLPRVRPQS